VVVLKLDATGKVVYSTFLGGTKNDEPTSMAVADDGTVYIGGVTMSSDFPGTRVGQFGTGGPPDGFVARFRPGDPKSLQTVLIGGAGREQVTGVALDKSGNLFVAGFTTSSDFPVKNGWQPRLGGPMPSWRNCESPTGSYCSPPTLEAQRWIQPMGYRWTSPAIRSSPE
jgi:hypothetical protein